MAADLFLTKNLKDLFSRKKIWLLGDSNMRAIYKDLVWLMQNSSIIPASSLKKKGESSFMGDQLTKGCRQLTRGRDYVEERRYVDLHNDTMVEFVFLTKVLTNDLENRLRNIRSSGDSPDVVVVNSCLWDVCRWGYNGVYNFKQSLVILMQLFRKWLGSDTLVIWTTTPPVAAKIKGGVFIQQIECLQPSCRFEMMEGNLFARQEVVASGYDILDFHYYLLHQIHRQQPDGIHWQPQVVRYQTNLLLTHISASWRARLPGNFVRKECLQLEQHIFYEEKNNQERPRYRGNNWKLQRGGDRRGHPEAAPKRRQTESRRQGRYDHRSKPY